MKKGLFFLASLPVLLASCASDELVVAIGEKDAPIGFTTIQKNITRATPLQKTCHYNFGVFAYKSTEAVNNIMANYLVGNMDVVNKKGYYMTNANQTTLGDDSGEQNGQSYWAYEKMGSAEYDYTGGEGYYTKDQAAYMSNVTNQYLRYWDKSADYTLFYAYAPYINGDKTATYDNSTHTLTLPEGSIKAGYDTPTDYEAMYAVAKVSSADYGKDVELSFQRLIAKVNIKFWEDLEGYSIRILDLKAGEHEGVQAVPAERSEAGVYTLGKYYKQAGAKIEFSNTSEGDAVTSTVTPLTSTEGEADEPLVFKAPTDAVIGTTRVLASPSATDYYAIPKNNESGFTFHVSYELISTTGEKIVVKDATVYVPKDYTNWAPNTHYTYIFKITKGSNGSTESDPTIDPTDPNVPAEPSLYPIVFDNCTVIDWTEEEHESEITSDTNSVNYSLALDKSEVKIKDITSDQPATVIVTLKENGTPVSSPAGSFSITGPDVENNVTINATGIVTVKKEAKAGTYTVKYTPAATEHAPASSYSVSFVVIGKNLVTVSTSEIGTGGTASTTLVVSTTCDGAASTPAANSLSIEYPSGLSSDQKNKVHVEGTTVTVENNAVAGSYQVVYTTEEGNAYAPFEVKNYGLTLSDYNINHNNTDQTITVTATDGVVALGGAYDGISLSGNTITVDKTTPEGTYTVIRTVTKGTDANPSVTTYVKTFTVKNVYELSLDKILADKDVTTEITVTSTVNAVASTNIVITPTDSKITYDPATGKITVAPDATTGTYIVQLTDGGTDPVVLKEVTFIVQD